MNDELNRYLAADKAEVPGGMPPALQTQALLNRLIYGTPTPSRDVVESVAANYFRSAPPLRQEFGPAPAAHAPFGGHAPVWNGPAPAPVWLDEMPMLGIDPAGEFPVEMVGWQDGEAIYAQQVPRIPEAALRRLRQRDFLCHALSLSTDKAEALIDLMLPVIHVGGRGFGKTYKADMMKLMEERLDTMHIPADFMQSAKHFGLNDPEGLRLVELIYRRRNPMTEPIELRNEEGEKSLALRFDGGTQGNTAMCRFLKGTYHTHHRAKPGQKEHVVITQDDKKLPVEAGDWVITNEGWGFSVFTADEYDKLNERSD